MSREGHRSLRALRAFDGKPVALDIALARRGELVMLGHAAGLLRYAEDGDGYVLEVGSATVTISSTDFDGLEYLGRAFRVEIGPMFLIFEALADPAGAASVAIRSLDR